MPVNASPEYVKAEKEYIEAATLEEKIECLKKMISLAPSHKGAENLRAELKSRLKKLTEKLEKKKSSGKTTQETIKKQEMQAIIIGFPNTGKTTLFNKLTNQNLEVSPIPFTTKEHSLGTTIYEDVKIFLIDSPPFPNTDKSLINNTDTILLVIDNLKQIEESQPYLEKTKAKIFIIFNKSDLLSEEEKRKIKDSLKTKYPKYKTFLINQNEDLEDLKKELFFSFPIIRVYTKEPKKEPSKDPMILKEDSTIKDAIEKISKSLIGKVKYAKIWGPSSKFNGQIVGLNHILKDKDIIELKIE